MACTALEAIVKGCDNNIGSITKIYINDLENVTVDPSTDIDLANWIITAMTVTADFEEFEFRRNTSNYTEEAAIDLINGSSFVTQTINLMFHRREGAKSRAIKILGEGQRDLAVIVLDGNGKYWYFEKVQVTAYGEGSGTAKADGSKYSLVLTAEAENLAYEVDPDVIPTVFS
jgi:hypothetical protein